MYMNIDILKLFEEGYNYLIKAFDITSSLLLF